MKITKTQLRKIIREAQLSEALPQFQKNARKAGAAASMPGSSSAGSKQVGDLEVVKGAFKGTSQDRSELNKKLEAQIKKMKASGKEKDLPADWDTILMRSDGDELAALQKHINPGMLKKMGKLFGLGESAIVESAPAAALRGGITDPDLDQLVIDYEDYVKAAGHITMASSSVAASFFMQDPERIEDHEAHQMLADAVGLDHTEIMRDMDRQKQEQSMSETLNWPDTWHRILGSTCKD